MSTGKKKGLLGRILSDSVWTIAGLVLMNVLAQFVVYPVWNRQMGNEAYGNALSLLSGMNILAISMGTACNYARMTVSAKGETRNRPYSRAMLAASWIAIPYMIIFCALTGNTGAKEEALLILLTILTMWRFYADVEYRLSLDYKGYFLYYLVISIGYGIGILLYLQTGLWPLALLPGEAAGLIWVAARGRVLRSEDEETDPEENQKIFSLIVTLFLSNLIGNLLYNGDRVILQLMMDGTAVSIYYQASLLGKTMTLITTPLNSVLIGYLARYKGGVNRRMMGYMGLGVIAACLIGTGVCTAASHILIRILYPQNYDLVKGYFMVANLAQIMYFAANVVLTVLLRFFRAKYQVTVNLIGAVLFIAFGIIGIRLGGLTGFCWSFVIVCLLRLGYAIWVGIRDAGKNFNGGKMEEEQS